jgi:hypothetical protein
MTYDYAQRILDKAAAIEAKPLPELPFRDENEAKIGFAALIGAFERIDKIANQIFEWIEEAHSGRGSLHYRGWSLAERWGEPAIELRWIDHDEYIDPQEETFSLDILFDPNALSALKNDYVRVILDRAALIEAEKTKSANAEKERRRKEFERLRAEFS